MAAHDTFALPTPEAFEFPFEPYAIQHQLMSHVFRAIEDGQVALVESPTGTGKSLSLITSTLTWLHRNQSRVKSIAMDQLRTHIQGEMENEPAWMIERELHRRQDELESQESDLLARIVKVREKEEKEKSARSRAHVNKKRKLEDGGALPRRQTANGALNDDLDFAPDEDFNADMNEDGLSDSVRALMARYRGRKSAVEEVDDEPEVTKIIYASRTHSQLSQFISEIRKTSFAEHTRILPLASRANLCINDEVRNKSRGVEDLNERCTELQKKGKKRCPYLPPADEKTLLNEFRDAALASVHTVEDLEELGRKRNVCPYYGSRRAIRQAHLVALPYQMVLSKDARESLGLSLTDNIVCIDEAHALIDTILGSHSVTINLQQIARTFSALKFYQERFRTRLKGINAANLAQLTALLLALENFCHSWRTQDKAKKKSEVMMCASDFVIKLGLDQVPVLILDQWIKEAKIARKVSGYAEAMEQRQDATDNTAVAKKSSKAMSATTFHRVQAFLVALANAATDGRIMVSSEPSSNTNEDNVILRYVLLNPEPTFRSIVEESRSVILAGGTMAPMQDFAQQLFSYLPPAHLSLLTCGHVVPQDHLLVRVLEVGPKGNRMELKYEARQDVKILDDLGQALVNIAAIVPNGIVCFLPSYSFLDSVLERWKTSGMLDRLISRKQTFVEPKGSGQTDNILQAYATAAEKGAVMLAVVGAKLSEGINFSDHLCRCVIIVSIPYPSLGSPELKERIAYVKSLGPKGGPDQGKILYSNLAFRAVNQAIGRSIRHAQDWSSIILLDARYKQSSAQQLLPGWIKSSVEVSPTFAALLKALGSFMKTKREPA